MNWKDALRNTKGKTNRHYFSGQIYAPCLQPKNVLDSLFLKRMRYVSDRVLIYIQYREKLKCQWEYLLSADLTPIDSWAILTLPVVRRQTICLHQYWVPVIFQINMILYIGLIIVEMHIFYDTVCYLVMSWHMHSPVNIELLWLKAR